MQIICKYILTAAFLNHCCWNTLLNNPVRLNVNLHNTGFLLLITNNAITDMQKAAFKKKYFI